MLERITELDVSLLVYLNSLGSQSFDSLWLFITKQFNWIPVFAVILYVVVKKFGWKHTLLILVMIALLITITDQTTNLVKNSIQRLRPCNNPDIMDYIRIVKSSNTFSFFSGHASNSMAAAFFIYRLLRPYYKYAWILFLWPLVFAYSRIYLGLHYPLDIICGYIWGIFTSSIVFLLYRFLRDKYFIKKD